MTIAYNESDRAIEIHDDLKSQHLIIKGLMLLLLLNALIRLYKSATGLPSYILTIWAGLGIVAVCVFGFFFFRKSSAESIRLKNIKRLKKKSVLGRKRYVFILKNGKERDLAFVQDEKDLNHLLHLCARVGIAV